MPIRLTEKSIGPLIKWQGIIPALYRDNLKITYHLCGSFFFLKLQRHSAVTRVMLFLHTNLSISGLQRCMFVRTQACVVRVYVPCVRLLPVRAASVSV